MDIAAVLTHKYPNDSWTLDGDLYEGLTWVSETVKPTQKELESLWPIVKKEISDAEKNKKNAQAAAIEHAKSLGFTEAMIAVMYPNLGVKNV